MKSKQPKDKLHEENNFNDKRTGNSHSNDEEQGKRECREGTDMVKNDGEDPSFQKRDLNEQEEY